MQQTLRPYATVGIAIVGSSLIAVTPVDAVVPGGHSAREVNLTAGETLPDLLSPWESVFNTTSENATQLANNYFLAPEVGLQQFIANQSDFWQQILNDPSNIPTVVNDMQEQLKAVTDAYALTNADAATIATTTLHTLNSGFNAVVNPDGSLAIEAGHAALLQLLPDFLPADQSATLTPLIDFLASPESAMIIGALGPAISPLVAMTNSITDGDDLNQTLANMYGAFLNGATLNLDGLIPLIEQSGLLPLPAGTTLNSLSFAFGGLLSTGEVGAGPYDLYDGAGNVVTSIPAVGGSIFNSLGLNITANLSGQSLPLNVDPVAVGPIGAWEAWSQTVAGLLGGSAWGWDAKSNPGVPSPPADPPLSGFSFPTIPADFFDDGGSSSTAADALGASADPTWLADLVAALGA